jgi:hypothetical protein
MSDPTLTNIVDPETNEVHSIPQEQLASAQQMGYRPASPEEVNQYFKEKEFSTPVEKTKAALEGGLSALTFGGSTAIEKALFDNAPQIEARAEVNPATRATAQVGALLIPSILTAGGYGAAAGVTGAAGAAMEAGGAGIAGLAGLGAESAIATAGKAALAAASEAGLGAEAAAAAVKAAQVAKAAEFSMAGRIGSKIVKTAAEGALFQSGEEASRMFSDHYQGVDPSTAAQLAATNVGMAALIGGGFGAAHGVGSELWNATIGKKIGNALSGAKDAVEANPNVEGMAIREGVEAKPINYRERAEAFNELGIENPTPAMISGDEFAGRTESTMSQRGTWFGKKMFDKTKDIWNKISDKAEELFKYRADKSVPVAAQELRDSTIQRFESRMDDLSARYKAHEPHFDNMAVSDELKQGIEDTLRNNRSLKTSQTARDTVDKFITELKNADTVTDLKNLRTDINKKLFKSAFSENIDADVLHQVKNELTKARETAITQATKSTGIGAEAGKISEKTIGDIRQLDAEYSQLKKEMRELADSANLGRKPGESLRELNKKLHGINDQTVIDRFFPEDNFVKLQKMKQSFPKEFELARRARLKQIHVDSFDSNGKFSVAKFLSQITESKMPPEVRNILFDGNGGRIDAIRVAKASMPKDFNPAHTAGATSFASMLSPTGWIQEGTDALQFAMLHSKPHIDEALREAGLSGEAARVTGLKFAANADKPVNASAFKKVGDFVANTLKGENALSKSTRAVFDSAQTVLPSKLHPDAADKKKLDKKLKDLQADNSPMFNVGTEMAHYLPNHSAGLSQTVAQGVTFLNSLRPNTDKQNPLDSDVEPSPMETAKFDRALEIAQQPMVVMQAVKDGEVTSHDINVLQNVYPALYARMKEKLTHEMIESVHRGDKIPYKTRLGISGFLGQPLDSTMTPMAIQTAQAGLAGAQAQQEQKQQTMQQQALKGGGKSLESLVTQSQTPQQARQSHKLGMA